MFFRDRWKPRGQHCYVTGGSSGLGLALAVLLTEKGAHVSIVARNKERLAKALVALEAVRQSPEQALKAYSYSVDVASDAAAALDAASQPHGGRCPDALFLCAGGSRPGFFIEQDEAALRQCMDETYWVQAWSALAASKKMVRDRIKGKIVFVSSLCGYMSLVGYATYSPGKCALRGLAEALQSELQLYDICVHIAFPGVILTPGYDAQRKTKPEVLMEIEASDPGSSPEAVADALLRGVQKGNFHITNAFIGDIFRASTAGSSSRHNYFLDIFYGLIGFIALPIWRYTVDAKVRAHRAEHERYLTDRAFFEHAT